MAKRKRSIKSTSSSPPPTNNTATGGGGTATGGTTTATNKPIESPSSNATTKTQVLPQPQALLLPNNNNNNNKQKRRTKNEINEAIEQEFDQINKQIECPICLSVLEDTQIVPSCQHRFCRECISSSLRKCKNECPSCRVPIATRRILRDDFEFGSLVQALNSISTSIQSEYNTTNLTNAMHALQSLTQHFVCPLCNDPLKHTFVSSECMHRFCSNCARAQDLPSGECPCCAIAGIGGDVTAVGVGVGGSGPSCSNSMFRNKTTFNEDKQLDQIIATVETIISLLSEALSIYGDDGDDDMSTVGCDKRVEEIVTNDEESFQEVYDVDDEESMDVDDRSMDYEGEEEDDEDVEVESITMEDPYSHLRKNAGFDQFHNPEEDDSSDDENYRRYTKQPQYEDEELNTVSPEEYSAVPTTMSQSEEKKKSSKRSNAEYNKDVTAVLDEPDSSDDESSISLSLNLKKKQDKTQRSFKNDSRKIVENSHGSTNDLQHNDELVIMDDVANEHHDDHQEDQPDRELESTGDTAYDHYFSKENSNSSHSDTTIPAKESILKQNLKWARPSPQTSGESDSPIGAQRNPSKSNRRVSFHDETSDMGSIRKQKKINPKYAIGTQFIGDINDPTSEKYGRIVGFDGSLYQVYYPKDKTCHSFHEADFEKVKIIQKSSHQRPKKRNQLSVVIKQPCCPECDRPFSSEMLDATKPNVPVQSQNCSHVICIDCVHALRVSNSQQSVGRGVNRIRGTVDCPICNNKQSFNGLNPTICVSMTQVVSMYNRMQTMKSTIMPTPKSRRRKRGEISEVERRMQKERAHEKFKKQKKKEAYHDRPGRQKEQKHREAPTSHPMNSDKGHHSADDVPIDTSSKHKHDERKKHTRQKEDCRTDEGYKRQKRSAEQGSRSHDREREEKSSKDKNREIKCSSCKRHKPKEKYSSKQQERNKQNKARVFCRRCEEKAIIQDKWGPGTAECSITLNISKGKFQSSTIKFLTSLVPWKYGRVSRQKIDVLPNDLTFDGYTRDSFGRLSNDDEEEERLWKKAEFWTTGDGISRFLDFLKKERKSAFGSFLLPNGKDGFFVLPYDQRDEPQDPKKRSGKNSVSKIVCFKYIIGLDIVGGGSSKADKHEAASGHYHEEFSNATSQEAQPSMLKQLLSAQSETENCLTQVPKGSVRTVLDAQTIPDLPQQSRGSTDWSRGGTVIVEESDRLRKEAKIEAESSSKPLATEESNIMKSENETQL